MQSPGTDVDGLGAAVIGTQEKLDGKVYSAAADGRSTLRNDGRRG